MQCSLLSSRHGRTRVNEKSHHLEGFGDRVPPPSHSLDLPKGVHNLLNPTTGRVVHTRNDVKDQPGSYSSVASNVSSRTSSPRNELEASSVETTSDTSGSAAMSVPFGDANCNPMASEAESKYSSTYHSLFYVSQEH